MLKKRMMLHKLKSFQFVKLFPTASDVNSHLIDRHSNYFLFVIYLVDYCCVDLFTMSKYLTICRHEHYSTVLKNLFLNTFMYFNILFNKMFGLIE